MGKWMIFPGLLAAVAVTVAAPLASAQGATSLDADAPRPRTVEAPERALEASSPGDPGDHRYIRGMTISCQTWGWEWGTPEFEAELHGLRALGVNWVAIHPYAAVRADGSVEAFRGGVDPDAPPRWMTAPIEAARRAGLSILVKPHLAYWGSPFSWRGEIRFEGEEARRFWREYTEWIVGVARITSGADAFCVGTELDRMLADTWRWREVVAAIRAVTPAHLTYAANWNTFRDVGFWDDLDAIGVQAYFPLSERDAPSKDELLESWRRVLVPLRRLHESTGKPVVFTELGYDAAPFAASEPWRSAPGGGHGDGAADAASSTPADQALQERLLEAGLDVVAREREWLRGAFLWKWFVGAPGRNDHSFHLDRPELRRLIESAWALEASDDGAGSRREGSDASADGR